MRIPVTILLLLVLVACGRYEQPPSNLSNACTIVKQEPSWHRAMKRTERRWGVPVSVQMATIYQESKFIKRARTPRKYVLWIIPAGRQSSAFGYSQAIDGTWDWYRRDSGNRLARRTSFSDSVDFIGWYMHQSTVKLGLPKTDARNHYLAYHEGHGGYKKQSYLNKAWLMGVATSVQARATRYESQLRSCR